MKITSNGSEAKIEYYLTKRVKIRRDEHAMQNRMHNIKTYVIYIVAWLIILFSLLVHIEYNDYEVKYLTQHLIFNSYFWNVSDNYSNRTAFHIDNHNFIFNTCAKMRDG